MNTIITIQIPVKSITLAQKPELDGMISTFADTLHSRFGEPADECQCISELNENQYAALKAFDQLTDEELDQLNNFLASL